MLCRAPLRTLMHLQNGPGEFRERIQRRLRRLAVRRMPGTGDDRDVDRTIAFFAGNFDLANRPIVIVGALHDGYRHADRGEVLRNVPVAEFWVEPRAVPSVE